MQRRRPNRSRHVTLWLDNDNVPVAFELEWIEDEMTQRYIAASIVVEVGLERLVRMLDQLPRTLDPRVLEYLDWMIPGNTEGGTHRLRYVMPGWKEDQRGHDWYLPTQLPLPYIPGPSD
jgi:hypothetical protein